jgi:acetamidase/formamidase
MSRHHVVEASPETIHWGVFDPSLRPILTVESGDSVTFHCVSGGRDAMPPPPYVVPPALRAIHERCAPRAPPPAPAAPCRAR